MTFFNKAEQLRAGGDAASKICLETCERMFNEGQSVGL